MPRFYLPPEEWLSTSPQLQAADAHHCAHVLRRKEGDTLTLFDGYGKQAFATIQEIHKKKILLSINPAQETPVRQAHITLAQAIPKAKNMDLIIQKAVELGAAEIIPLITDRTIIRCTDDRDALQKQERWQAIAIEACKQSGQNWLPLVHQPCSVSELLKKTNPDHLLLLTSLEKGSISIKQALASFQQQKHRLNNTIPQVTVMVGPEGDFTPEEHSLAKNRGYEPVSLGPIILRTETAAFYCLSVLSYELFS